MWFPVVLGLSMLGWASATQIPLSVPQNTQHHLSPNLPPYKTMNLANKIDFSFKEGDDVFSPKDMLEAPRPGAGVANPAGDLVLVSVSKYSFANKTTARSIWLAPTNTDVQPFQVPLDKVGEAFWLDNRTFANAIPEGDGKDLVVALYAVSVTYSSGSITLGTRAALIGKFPTASATNFIYQARAGKLVFSDKVYEDEDINTVKANDEAWENRGNTALVYDETYERHWDHWILPKKNTLLSVDLTVDPAHEWHLGSNYVNLLNGTGHHSPVEPFGGTDDFDVSETSVIYTTLDPTLSAAWHTKQDVYIVPIDGSSSATKLTSGLQGATHVPVFNKQGDKAAWLELDRDGHESDRAKIVIYDLAKNVRYTLTQNWDRSADGLSFSPSGDTIYFTGGDTARVKVFALPIPDTPSESTTNPDLPDEYQNPVSFTSTGAASGIQALTNGRVLIALSSLTTPNDAFILSNLDSVNLRAPRKDVTAQIQENVSITQLTKFSVDALQGKNLVAGDEFWFEGAEGKQVQGWIIKPPGFQDSDVKKWPVAFLIHGGPESAWADQWSTRWNPNVFAAQGYFTITINPTGSTTFGQAFTDAIQKDWGGKPFVDLRNGWQYVVDNYPQIDTERAAAAGASYGGYAINWIQGHPEFGFGFKALVCHDGVFDARFVGFYTDELFFPNNEFGGRPWDDDAKDIYTKWSPAEFAANWSTPQLIFHNSKDYRLVEAEGLAAFHVLQQKSIPSRFVVFPDENHWVLNPGNSLKWHYELFRWFDKFVGPNATSSQ